MSLYSPPPSAHDFSRDKPTLLVCWWTTLFSAAIILFRVSGRYIRTERLFTEDWIAFACLIPLFGRMALVHVILLWGTNNVENLGLTDTEIYHRSIGSKLVLASRIFYAATLWTLKLAITEFFKRLTLQIWRRSHEIMLQTIRWILLVTFVAVVISDLAECQPFSHYWQVTPDPGGHCRQGYAQLIAMGTANVLTDLSLVIFPIPILIRSAMPLKRKIHLIALFGLSLFPVAITLYRVPAIIDRQGVQSYRSLWASIEIVFATAAANALVLGSFVRDKGVKKVRWRVASVSDSIERSVSRRGTAIRHWGSDEDLVRGLGLGVDRELRGGSSHNAPVPPRPAPMVVHGVQPATTMAATALVDGKPGVDEDWRFSRRSDVTSEELDLAKFGAQGVDSGIGIGVGALPPMLGATRKVSFFDIGGLLDLENTHHHRRESAASTSTGRSSSLGPQVRQAQDPAPLSTTTTTTTSVAFDAHRSSHHATQDLGSNYLVPQVRTPRQDRSHESVEMSAFPRTQQAVRPAAPRGHFAPPHPSLLEETTIPSLQLRDIGGLLR